MPTGNMIKSMFLFITAIQRIHLRLAISIMQPTIKNITQRDFWRSTKIESSVRVIN